MKTNILQLLARIFKKSSDKSSQLEPKSSVSTVGWNAKSSPRGKTKEEFLREKIAALIQRGENLRDECSKVSATLKPTDVTSWEKESKTFIDQNQTADEQVIAERVFRVPINAASLPAPRDAYFVTIVHVLQHLNIISKRLNSSSPPVET